jgi:hypothetical protein
MNILDISPINGPDDCNCEIRLNIAPGCDYAQFLPVKAWPCWIKSIRTENVVSNGNGWPRVRTILVVEFITLEDRNACLQSLAPHPTQ